MGAYGAVDLFLIRHGVTDWNKQKRYLGHTDRVVIKEELDQSRLLKEHLQQIRFDGVFTSDLKRCRETLSFLNVSKSATLDARLREMDFGDWEGKTYEHLKDDEAYRSWLTNWEENSIPNGESGVAFKTRVDSFLSERFEEASKNGQKVLVVTHGGVIRYIVSKFQPSESFWDIPIKHGNGIKLSLVRKAGIWQCNSLSEALIAENERS